MRSVARTIGTVAILSAWIALFYVDATGETWPLAFSIAMLLVAFACAVALETHR